MSFPFLKKDNDTQKKVSSKKASEVMVAPVAEKKPAKTTSQGNAPHWEMIRHPWFTEKALRESSQNKYVFRVADSANKTEIKKLFERGYGVKVMSVHTVSIPGKSRRRRGGHANQKSGYKKAIITLAEGSKLEFATQ